MPDSVSASALIARSRTSLLNMSMSAVSCDVVSSAAAASSVAAVLAVGGGVAVPSVYPSLPSALDTLVLSALKSLSTSSLVLIVATATMSAGVIVVSTYLVAESTARCTSSGCIDAMSKRSTIRRRPASSSDVIGFGGASSAAGAGVG